MINVIQKNHYVSFFDTKKHKIFKVLGVNKIKKQLYIECQHCKMKLHDIPYYLMEIIPTPKNIKQSKLKVKNR